MKFVPAAVTRTVGRSILKTQKHSPAILFAAGILGVGTTVVLACKATLQLEDVITEAEKDLANVDELALANKSVDTRREKAYIYGRYAGTLIRLYGPSVALGTVSVCALAGSHGILSRRNASLTAAYVALDKGFEEYRERVRQELGDDKDREFNYGVAEREVAVDTKNGPKVEVIKTASGLSGYSRCFDEDNRNWVHTPEFNINFLRMQQQFLTDRLRAKGHLFLNEAYDALGMERSKAGQQVGWLWQPNNKNRDGYVDFGIFQDERREQLHEFLVGAEGCLMIDFNVDGLILEDI